MLTPRFELSQTENEVTIVIYAPYANIKDTLVEVNGTDFRFYSTPYYLRLNLPGEIEENDASTGAFDSDKQDFTLKFAKVNKGEHFENLDMITNLLAPSKKKKNPLPTIEVISNPCTSGTENVSKSEEKSDDQNKDQDEDDMSDSGDQWYTDQNPPSEIVQLPVNLPKYGFANKISGALAAFEEAWIKEIIDLPFPDKTLMIDRQNLREQNELESFDEDHYLADLMEPGFIEPYLSYECKYKNLTESDVQLNNEEKDLLKELPNKEYLMDENETKIALYSMIDILYAACYNTRTTFGENTVESGWSVNKISSTLCWFQSFSNLHDVLKSSIRRSLCYPLVRNWDLAQKVFEDLKIIIKLGKKCIIKHFCEIHSLFNNSNEPRYILNQLYIKDYLVWLQKISNSMIEELNLILENINIKKEELGLDLVELEEAAHSVQNENLVIENELYSLPEDLEKLVIGSEKSNVGNGNALVDLDSDGELDSDDTSSSSDSSDSSDSDSSSSDEETSNSSIKSSSSSIKSSSSSVKSSTDN